jgi:hydrogenase 3 maturation protease
VKEDLTPGPFPKREGVPSETQQGSYIDSKRGVFASKGAPPRVGEGLGERSSYHRLAILGIGNELNGDDAAGVLAARALKRLLEEQGSLSSDILIIEAGPAPESFGGPLRRFQPDLVIFIDAAELGEPPGTLRTFDWSEAEGMSGSTHTLPPSMLARFLVAELGCEVRLVGIQPKSLEFDGGVSAEVQAAIEEVAEQIAKLLS